MQQKIILKLLLAFGICTGLFTSCSKEIVENSSSKVLYL